MSSKSAISSTSSLLSGSATADGGFASASIKNFLASSEVTSLQHAIKTHSVASRFHGTNVVTCTVDYLKVFQSILSAHHRMSFNDDARWM
jgi:hypothetical protein